MLTPNRSSQRRFQAVHGPPSEELLADGSDGVTVDPGGASAARSRAGWSRFHLKGYKRHDGSKPELPSDLHPVLTAVYVPLVAVLLFCEKSFARHLRGMLYYE